MKDLIVSSIACVDLDRFMLPAVAVHQDPIEHPGKNVARIFDVSTPTNTVIIKDTLEEIMEDIKTNTDMVFLKRTADDTPSLVGVWL